MTVRKYGKPPFTVAVLHGGPGAPGYMAPVGRELSQIVGVLEPLQSKQSLDEQVEELKDQLVDNTDGPATLIGSSWGALLALFLAARERSCVKKIILVGSAVFDADSSAKIEPCRLERLTEKQRQRYTAIMSNLDQTFDNNQSDVADEWGRIFFTTDVYDPITTNLETLEVQYELHKKVWSDYVALRDRPGYLKSEFSSIDVPTVLIHGDYDPHPIEGIRPFLEECLSDIHFHILPECGHYPWIERRAREKFFNIVKNEM
jgi:pimeloyl-ACP methyl ester carboxylesterase